MIFFNKNIKSFFRNKYLNFFNLKTAPQIILYLLKIFSADGFVFQSSTGIISEFDLEKNCF